jgi:hypothetical protein
VSRRRTRSLSPAPEAARTARRISGGIIAQRGFEKRSDRYQFHARLPLLSAAPAVKRQVPSYVIAAASGALLLGVRQAEGGRFRCRGSAESGKRQAERGRESKG